MDTMPLASKLPPTLTDRSLVAVMPPKLPMSLPAVRVRLLPEIFR
jgi:hypothetical protein